MDTGLTAKVFCYANMIVTLFRVSANQISVFFPIPFQQLVFSLVRLLTRNLFSDFEFHFIFRTHPSLLPTILVYLDFSLKGSNWQADRDGKVPNRLEASDAENSRSACFDWHNFIRTGLNFEILVALVHIHYLDWHYL